MDEKEFVKKLLELLEEVGWSIALPDNDEVQGAIIGTEEYIDTILESLPEDLFFKKEKLSC